MARKILDYEGVLMSRPATGRGLMVREECGQIRELWEVVVEAVGGDHAEGSAWSGRMRLILEAEED